MDLRLPDDGAADLLHLAEYNLTGSVRALAEMPERRRRRLGRVWPAARRRRAWPPAACTGRRDVRPPARRAGTWPTRSCSAPRSPTCATSPPRRTRPATSCPTLVLPPQAGHSSMRRRLLPRPEPARGDPVGRPGPAVRAGLAQRDRGHHRASASPTTWTSSTARSGIMGGRANLVGDCQGGWLAAIYAALHPERVHTLTLAGAPIDFHAGESVIAASTRALTSSFGLAPYRALVAAGGGNMPGRAVLGNFIAIRRSRRSPASCSCWSTSTTTRTSSATASSRTGSSTPRTSPARSTCGWSSTCSGATS